MSPEGVERFRKVLDTLATVRFYRTGYGAEDVHRIPQDPDEVRNLIERLIDFSTDVGTEQFLDGIDYKSLSSRSAAERLWLLRTATGPDAERAIQAVTELYALTTKLQQQVQQRIDSARTELRRRELELAQQRDLAIQKDRARHTDFTSGLSESDSLHDIATGALALPENMPLHALTYGVASGVVIIPQFALGQRSATGRDPRVEPYTVGALRTAYDAGLRFAANVWGSVYDDRLSCRYLSSARNLTVAAAQILVPRRLAAERVVDFMRLSAEADELARTRPPLRML